MNAADKLFLEAAVELAERGRMTCAPNPTVGCLIVKGLEVLGRGFHARAGEGHAEVNAIADAGGQANVAGTTVYVSLEPCTFEGRTPACVETLIAAKVARVVVAARDPHPRVAGRGMALLREAGVDVDLLPLEAAERLIEGYVSRVVKRRPFVRVKTASSLDGATALASGESQWITGEAARADVQYWRARSDAVITGIGTVLADDPRLNVRDPRFAGCNQPLRVVLDRGLRTPPAARVLDDSAPTLLVHDAGARLEGLRGVECVGLTDGLPQLLAELADRGCNEVLVEAGPRVVGSFAAASLWDEWLFYLAPKLLGADARPLADFKLDKLADAMSGKVAGLQTIGSDIRVRMRR